MATLAQINAEKIFPVFEKRFPGIKVNHVDATSDKLVARAVTEARGGKTFGDVLQVPLENVSQAPRSGIDAGRRPCRNRRNIREGLKGAFWTASDLQYFIAAWNTAWLRKKRSPRAIDDFVNPALEKPLDRRTARSGNAAGLCQVQIQERRKGDRLCGEKIAANNVEFHTGHSQLAELLVAGQAAVCLTCYSHHYPSRIKKGAPVNYMLSEGVASINGTAVFKNAPHPNTALLFARWVASQEGQKVMAQGGRKPAHPKVEPVDKTRTEKTYSITRRRSSKSFPSTRRSGRRFSS